MNKEALLNLSPDKLRHLLNHAASRDLFTFLGRVHPIVTPESQFIDAEHLHVLAWHVQQVVKGKMNRLAVAIPPRHFKSFVASVAMPAWALGQDPSLRIVCASYGSDLAKRFAEQSRSVMLSGTYRRIFPGVQLRSKQPALDRLITTSAGYRMATSVGGVLTGMGADIVVVDDPMKASDAESLIERENVFNWFKGSLMSRFDKPTSSKVIVVMQRLHQDDLVGRLLAKKDGPI